MADFSLVPARYPGVMLSGAARARARLEGLGPRCRVCKIADGTTVPGAQGRGEPADLVPVPGDQAWNSYSYGEPPTVPDQGVSVAVAALCSWLGWWSPSRSAATPAAHPTDLYPAH